MEFTAREACVDISITDDDLLERDTGFLRETFTVQIRSNDSSVKVGEMRSAEVVIEDDDSK